MRSLAGFRFLLGLGESANWPGATKAVAEWFPRRESGWAVALFDSGSSIGAALAPFIVLGVYKAFGSWRPAFIATGLLGFLWIPLFRWLYRSPEEHPRLSAAERADILANRGSGLEPAGSLANRPLDYRVLLSLPQTWGIVIGKALTDPVWFFITDWLAIYLVSRGFALEDSLLAFWVPFVAADLGNFAGGGVSSALITRGWRVGAARNVVIVVGTLMMLMLIPAIYTTRLVFIAGCLAVATFGYAALSTMILNLPADIYPRNSVASVSGMSGNGRRHRDDHRHVRHGFRRGSVFVRTAARRGQPHSARRDGGAAAARQEQPRDIRWYRQPNLVVGLADCDGSPFLTQSRRARREPRTVLTQSRRARRDRGPSAGQGPATDDARRRSMSPRSPRLRVKSCFCGWTDTYRIGGVRTTLLFTGPRRTWHD